MQLRVQRAEELAGIHTKTATIFSAGPPPCGNQRSAKGIIRFAFAVFPVIVFPFPHGYLVRVDGGASLFRWVFAVDSGDVVEDR